MLQAISASRKLPKRTQCRTHVCGLLFSQVQVPVPRLISLEEKKCRDQQTDDFSYTLGSLWVQVYIQPLCEKMLWANRQQANGLKLGSDRDGIQTNPCGLNEDIKSLQEVGYWHTGRSVSSTASPHMLKTHAEKTKTKKINKLQMCGILWGETKPPAKTKTKQNPTKAPFCGERK